jgi:hypothetical protein
MWSCLGCGFDDVGPPFGATIGPASFVPEFLELDEQSSWEESASEVLGHIKDFKCDLPWAVSIGEWKRGSSVEMASCARMLGSGPGAAFSPSGLLIDVIGGGAAMVSSHQMAALSGEESRLLHLCLALLRGFVRWVGVLYFFRGLVSRFP